MMDEVRENLANILFLVYSHIPFQKFRKVKSIRDVFNHRVRSASKRQNLETFVSKLCNYFGIQQLPTGIVEYVNRLKPFEQEALDLLNNEHIYLCSLAFLKFEQRKKEAKNEN